MKCIANSHVRTDCVIMHPIANSLLKIAENRWHDGSMEKQRIAILFYMQASNSCFGVAILLLILFSRYWCRWSCMYFCCWLVVPFDCWCWVILSNRLCFMLLLLLDVFPHQAQPISFTLAGQRMKKWSLLLSICGLAVTILCSMLTLLANVLGVVAITYIIAVRSRHFTMTYRSFWQILCSMHDRTACCCCCCCCTHMWAVCCMAG